MRVHQSNRTGRQAPTSAQGRSRAQGEAIVSNPRNYERYLALARDAAQRGDNIEAENLYQHAEHYFRQMRDRTIA
jgi:Domain of unknown function (DUF4167)